MSSSLYRLDDLTWSYTVPKQTICPWEQVYVETSEECGGDARFALAQATQKLFDTYHNMTPDLLERGVSLTIKNHHKIEGSWLITSRKTTSVFWLIIDTMILYVRQWIPFFHRIERKKTITVSLQKVENTGLNHLMLKIRKSLFATQDCHQQLSDLKIPIGKDQKVETLFSDPFTKLAAVSLQTRERYFVPGPEHKGSFRFVYIDNYLSLKKCKKSSPDEEKQENRVVVEKYRDFLVKMFGKDFVAQLCLSYQIDFDKMIEEGDPLFPDHVFKCNIGANNIELTHIEKVWGQLKLLYPHVKDHSKRCMNDIFGEVEFTDRVRLKLLAKCPTIQDLQKFLEAIVGSAPPDSVRKLTPQRCNEVISLIASTDEELERAFTGREIRHLAISGYPTMGDKNVPDPCRDLFELLHIFKLLRQCKKWKDYCEFLSHVVVKKSLFRKTPPNDDNPWHVGLLIPGPTIDQQESWLFNDLFVDDGEGYVGYGFNPIVPYVRKGRMFPGIRGERSTASNGDAISSLLSVVADLNPSSPGSRHPEVSYPYEKAFFEKRTIPLWVAYLVASKKVGDSGGCDFLKNAAQYCRKYLKKHATHNEICRQALQTIHVDHPDRVWLKRLAKQLKERPKDKISQDIFLLGHSLGAACSQFGMSWFFAQKNRVPLPGQRACCYSSNGPAIDTAAARKFMRYGHENQVLFKKLGVQFRVYLQFEYGDFVPQSGNCHLGTDPIADSSSWLRFKSKVFRPLDTATDKAIVTLSTHGRRIGTAKEGLDYCIDPLSQEDLSSFDHSWWLNHRISSLFGYRIFKSPKILEGVRRIAGTLLYYPLLLIGRHVGEQPPQRDKNGVYSISYHPSV